MAEALIGFVALFLLGMGVYALLRPAALVAPFGISLRTADARAEVRAVYGGFGVAMAALLGLAAADFAGLRFGVSVSTAAALAGMALGRLVARLFEAPVAFYPSWFYFWLELAAASMLLIATRL